MGLGASSAPAHTGPSLSGRGTATIDGVESPGEWAGAATAMVPVQIPSGGAASATLYVMNDATNLYMAVRLSKPWSGDAYVLVEVDNDHDGIRENGDDSYFLRYRSAISSASLGDNYRTNQPPCEPGHEPAYCAPADEADGGTTDGSAAAGLDGAGSFYEFSHPLDSADDGHDFSLSPGDTVGLDSVELSLCPEVGSCERENLLLLADLVVTAGGSLVVSALPNTTGDLVPQARLTVTLLVDNPGIAAVASIYLGIVLPDGDTTVLITQLGQGVAAASLADLSTFQPLLAGLDLNAPFAVTVPEFFSYRFVGFEPEGRYTLFTLVTPDGALDDGVLSPAEVLASSVSGFGFAR